MYIIYSSSFKLFQHISNWMKVLNWQVEMDTFTDQTPVGAKEFTNVIATLDHKSPRRLVLACHYDSKPSSDGLFVGATDSAVPCGMMMQLALDLRSELAALKRKVGIQYLRCKLWFPI